MKNYFSFILMVKYIILTGIPYFTGSYLKFTVLCYVT